VAAALSTLPAVGFELLFIFSTPGLLAVQVSAVAAVMAVAMVAVMTVVVVVTVATVSKRQEWGDLADDAVGAGHRRPDVRVDRLNFDDPVPRNAGSSTAKFAFRTL
jgi:hypothetical protein